MVSYEELIYHFTDIYMKSAMECSICKENYTMIDDTVFLDEYMKLFVSLLAAVEKDQGLTIDTIKETLSRKKEDKLAEFRVFLQYKVAEQALEMAEKESRSLKNSLEDYGVYVGKIQKLFKEIFDEEGMMFVERPKELLRYIRDKEESLS